MARIAIIQSHPYDAVAGGDGAYIQSFSEYLEHLGHEIHGLVTDMTRGRTSPVYQSFFRLDKYRSWRVRNAVRIGRRTFVDYNFSRIPFKLLERLGWRGAMAEEIDDAWTHREALWSAKQLEKLRPDVIILCFDAVRFAASLTSLRRNILALPGPIPGREMKTTLDESLSAADQNEIRTVQARLAGALTRADCVGLNCHDELTYATEHLQVKRAIVVGMGFPSHPTFAESTEPILLFVGNATAANRAGIRWFLTHVWPVILGSCPEARLRIVGKVAFSNEAGGAASVDRVGQVSDLTPEYRRAQVVIAPLVSGTAGVKVKVAEAMSYGRPLVTTSIGAEGGDPRQLDPAAIIADDPDDFAGGTIALLKDPSFRREKSNGATKVFDSFFSRHSAYGELSEWIDRVVPPAGLFAQVKGAKYG